MTTNSITVQFKRGNTAQTSAFTGAVAELTIDTDKKALVVHDGVTPGGNYLLSQSVINNTNANVTTTTVLAQAAFDKANTGGADSYARTTANTGLVLAQAAYNQANVTIGVDATQNTKLTVIEGTDVSQNARIVIIEGVNATQNTNIASTDGKIRSSYDQEKTRAL